MPTATTSAAIAKLDIHELNRLIRLATMRFEVAQTATTRKFALANLVWLERERERLHGIAAPARR